MTGLNGVTSKQLLFNKYPECRYKVKKIETSISSYKINTGKMNKSGLSGRLGFQNVATGHINGVAALTEFSLGQNN